MKKLILLAILSCLTFGIYSQSPRIGYSYTTIKNEFSQYAFKTNYTSDGTLTLTIIFPNGETVYYFNDSYISYMCAFIPKYVSTVNSLIQTYNDEYVIISENVWKAYLANGATMDIKLLYDSTIGYVFYYY